MPLPAAELLETVTKAIARLGEEQVSLKAGAKLAKDEVGNVVMKRSFTPQQVADTMSWLPAYKTHDGQIFAGTGHMQVLQDMAQKFGTDPAGTVDKIAEDGFMIEGQWTSRQEAEDLYQYVQSLGNTEITKLYLKKVPLGKKALARAAQVDREKGALPTLLPAAEPTPAAPPPRYKGPKLEQLG